MERDQMFPFMCLVSFSKEHIVPLQQPHVSRLGKSHNPNLQKEGFALFYVLYYIISDHVILYYSIVYCVLF